MIIRPYADADQAQARDRHQPRQGIERTLDAAGEGVFKA